MVGILGFLFGLATGLLLLIWQRSHSNRKIKQLLKVFKPEVVDIPFSTASQLSLAIAYQQQVQQRLEQQNQMLERVVAQMPFGLLQVDDENQVMQCNAEARRLLCIATERSLPSRDDGPRLLLELVRSYELHTLIERTRDSQVPCQSDWVFYPYNTDPTRLSKQKSYALRGHGVPLVGGHVVVFLENRQEAVVLAQQRDRWTSDVAHELKTPLTSIRLIAETLQTRLDSSLQGWADRLINQTTRLSNLVQDLLDLSQLEQDAFANLNLSDTDLVSLVHTAWNNLEPIARKKNVGLQYVGVESLLIEIDEARFYRVLINLLDNSIKFSPPWSVIRVQIHLEPTAGSFPEAIAPESVEVNGFQSNSSASASASTITSDDQKALPPSMPEGDRPASTPPDLPPPAPADSIAATGTPPVPDHSSDQWVYLDVIDSGPGFNPQDLPHVFERFYRADMSRARSHMSTSQEPRSRISPTTSDASDVSKAAIRETSGEPHQTTRGSSPSWAAPSTGFKSASYGSGLGLSIVRQIVEAHHGMVTARNHPQTRGAWLQIRVPRSPIRQPTRSLTPRKGP